MFQLKNGIRVILKERKNVPMANIRFFCLGGLSAETKKNNGISNLMVGLLLKGTKTRKEAEITSSFEEKGAYISSDSSTDCFSININCQSKDLSFSLEMLQDIIINSVFPEQEFVKVVERTQGLIKRENDNAFKLGYKAMKKGIFGQSPYALNQIGTEQSILDISVLQVKEFYKKFLIPDNIVISIVGDIDVQQTKKELEGYFEKIPKKKQQSFMPITSLQVLKEEDVQIDLEKEASVYIIGFKGALFSNDDKYALDVLFTCMSGAGGRLFSALRNDNALTYSQGGSSDSSLYGGFCYFYLQSSAETVVQAKKILIDQIDGIFSKPLTKEEINAAKKTLIFNRKSAMQSNSLQSALMGSDEIFGEGYEAYNVYATKIKDIKYKDVRSVAKKYIDLTRSFSVTVKPREV